MADAVTGKPRAQVQRRVLRLLAGAARRQGNRFRVNTKNFAELTDADGLVQLPADEANRRLQWLAIATTPAGAARLPGLQRRLVGRRTTTQQYKQVKVFTITDRPVYRPGQEVHFKFWVANAKFDQPDASPFAGAVVPRRDPRPARREGATRSRWWPTPTAGSPATWTLPAGATLGQYQLIVVNHGGGSFRVEEYKKPEYEVTIDAPDEAGAARRQDHRDDHGEVLLRLAR